MNKNTKLGAERSNAKGTARKKGGVFEVTWSTPRNPDVRLEPAILDANDLDEVWSSGLRPGTPLKPKSGSGTADEISETAIVLLVAAFGLSEGRFSNVVRQIEQQQHRSKNFVPVFLTDHPAPYSVSEANFSYEYFPPNTYGVPMGKSAFLSKFVTAWHKWNARRLVDFSVAGHLAKRIDDLESYLDPPQANGTRFNPRIESAPSAARVPTDLIALKAEYFSGELSSVADTFVLYRILGNDLPPRHAEGQTLKNLRYILENERAYSDCDKRWVVNRILDPKYEAEIIGLLEAHGQEYLRIPFEIGEYSRCDWDFDPFPQWGFFYRGPFDRMSVQDQSRANARLRRKKINYAINNNGARNAALRDGRQHAKWVLPWDGNCFLTEDAWQEISSKIRDVPFFKYFAVPMVRIADNDEIAKLDRSTADMGEPQIVFRCDAAEEFNEGFPYGRRPKVELLWRLGISGEWDAWRDDIWDLPRPGPAEDAGSAGEAGWVIRLESGRKASDGSSKKNLVDRGLSRNDAILHAIDGLDRQVLADNLDPNDLKVYDAQCIATLASAPVDTVAGRLFQRLLQEAELALQRSPFSVVQKSQVAPSGDKHDYYHPAPYWWPNPDTADGLPGVMRDGERAPGTELYSPESDRYDRTRLQRMFDDTTVLTLAGSAIGNTTYLERAAALVRCWFLEPDTRMNPHLSYAQVRPNDAGSQGAPSGIIEFKDIYFLLDAIRILDRAGTLSDDDVAGLKTWLRDYLDWLLTSDQGTRECKAKNNHGTCYDLQVASIAAYLSDLDTLLATFRRARERIPEQFEISGAQRHELKRTLSAHYCCFNLQCWTHLAKLFAQCGDRLWDFETQDGHSLAKGFDWLLPKFMRREWGDQQIARFDWDRFLPLTFAANEQFGKTETGTAAFRCTRKPVFYPHDAIMPFWMLSFGPHARNSEGTSKTGQIIARLRKVTRSRTVESNKLAYQRTETEARLWGGYSKMAIQALQDTMDRPDAPVGDRSDAAWALARWHSFAGDHTECLAAIQARKATEKKLMVRDVLVEADSLTQQGRHKAARDLIENALAYFPDEPSLLCAMANTYTDGDGGFDPEIDRVRLSWINKVFTLKGLCGLAKADPSAPLGIFNLAGDTQSLPASKELNGSKVSIIIPVFNGTGTIAVALRGLLDQTWQNLQIIVSDDASTDSTCDVVREIARADPRVELVANSCNQGAYAARNAGLKHASGDFITVHDVDDWSHPQKIEFQVREAQRHGPQYAILTDWVRVTEPLYFMGNWRPAATMFATNHSSLLLSAEALTELGGWDQVRFGADNEFISRFKTRFGADRISTALPQVPLSFSLTRPESLTRTQASHVRTIYHGIRLDYRRNYRRWHRKIAAENGTFHLPLDGERQFPVPRAMLPDSDGIPSVDKLFLADFGEHAQRIEIVARLIEANVADNDRIGIFHWPDCHGAWSDNFDPAVAELLDSGKIEQISAYCRAKAETLILCDPYLARVPIDGLSAIEARQLHAMCIDAGSLDSAFDPRKRSMPTKSELEDLFGIPCRWIPFCV